MKSPLVFLTAFLGLAIANPVSEGAQDAGLEKRQASGLIQDGSTFIISSAAVPRNVIDLQASRPGGNLIGYGRHGGANQQFVAKWLGWRNEYGLINRRIREWVVTPANRSGVQLKTKRITDVADNSVRWIAQRLPNGRYVFRSKINNNLVIDLEASKSTNGAKILAYNYHGGPNQQWTLQRVRGY